MSVKIKSTISHESHKFRESMRDIKSTVAKVGWFNEYPDGTSVAKIALQNEMGAVIQTHHRENFGKFVGPRKNLGLNIARHNKKYGDQGPTSQVIIIPPRPFLRPTISEKSVSWINIMKRGIKKVLAGSESMSDVMNLVGHRAAFDIRKKITDIYSPPLSPNTIKARMSKRGISSKAYASHKNFVGPQKRGYGSTAIGNLDKPLVDSGYMRDTITHNVSTGKGGE